MRTTSTMSLNLRRVALALALTGGLSGAALAQSDDSMDAGHTLPTRASTRADLVNLERAGYDPEADRVTYPRLTSAVELRANPPTRAQYPVADTSQSTTP